MAEQTLVQALEGVFFPCDRAQLIDYARRNNLGDSTLAVLEEIPERQYRDLDELFTVLPEAPQEPSQSSAEDFPPLPQALEWWLTGCRQAMLPWEVTAHCLRGSAETWPQWLRLSRHLWFPWSK